jgi:hypothetical protein
MNAGNQPIIVIPMDCNCAVLQLTTALKSAGYQVVQSFDLHSAMNAHGGHHSGRDGNGNCIPDSCACQMVVLLVYAQEGPPVTMICDSDELKTNVYLVNDAQQSAHPHRIGKLAQLLPDAFSSINQATSQATYGWQPQVKK